MIRSAASRADASTPARPAAPSPTLAITPPGSSPAVVTAWCNTGNDGVASSDRDFSSVARNGVLSVMAEFRYEYVSGVFLLDDERVNAIPSLDFFIANRGNTVESARGTLLEKDVTRLDSGDRTVSPGDVAAFGWARELEDPDVDFRPWYWARIFTTSVNLVPSIRLDYQTLQGGQSQPPLIQAYVGPGDFAVFELPYRPFLPEPPDRAPEAKM